MIVNYKVIEETGNLIDHRLLKISDGKLSLGRVEITRKEMTKEFMFKETSFEYENSCNDRLLLIFVYDSINFDKIKFVDRKTTREIVNSKFNLNEEEEKPELGYYFYAKSNSLDLSYAYYKNLTWGDEEKEV